MTRDELYGSLVRLCQTFGTTTETTYDLLHSVIDSIGNDDLESDLIGPVPMGGYTDDGYEL